MKTIDAPALAQWLADPGRTAPQLLDVREPWELDICKIGGSVPVPLRSLPAALNRIDAKQPVVCICHHGGRSAYAAMFLAQHGMDAYNLTGGINAWAQQVDPAMAKY